MKKIAFITCLILITAGRAFAQMENPIRWTYTAQKTGDRQYELHITATLENKWHVYAQDAGEGPEPTSIKFSPNPLVKLDGKIKEVGKLETMFDPNFNSTLRFYSDKVDFVQKIRLKSGAATVVKGKLKYMVCNDRKCLPWKEIPFSIKVSAK